MFNCALFLEFFSLNLNCISSCNLAICLRYTVCGSVQTLEGVVIF